MEGRRGKSFPSVSATTFSMKPTAIKLPPASWKWRSTEGVHDGDVESDDVGVDDLSIHPFFQPGCLLKKHFKSDGKGAEKEMIRAGGGALRPRLFVTR